MAHTNSDSNTSKVRRAITWVVAAALAAVLVAGALGALPASWTEGDATNQPAVTQPVATQQQTQPATSQTATQPALTFRNAEKLQEHFEKQGVDMGFPTAAEYEAAAANVVANPDALHKTQADGDECYYVPDTDEFVVVSTKGYLRTYFICSGRAYFERQ